MVTARGVAPASTSAASAAGDAAARRPRLAPLLLRSAVLAACLALSLPATALTITSTFFFRDNQDPVQPTIIPGIGGGDALTIGVLVDDITQVTTGTATHAPSSAVFDLATFRTVFPTVPIVATDLAYDATKLVGSDWTISLNGGAASSSPTRDLTGVPAMPLVTNLNVSGSASNPTITWQLPTPGPGVPTVDRVQVQIYNDDTNSLIAGRFFSAGTTSTTVQEVLGVSAPPGQLAVRIIPINGGQALADQVTRSSNWIVIDTTGSKAAGQVAVLTTGSPVTLTQAIDTPALPFLISFEYLFTTLAGQLTVFLDGIPIGVPLIAPGVLAPDFLFATFEVDNPMLLGESGIFLTFQLDGPAGSQVLIDNISAPGLENGTFSDDLTAWQAGGEGVVALTTIPEPSAISLLLLSLAGIVLARRRRGAARAN